MQAGLAIENAQLMNTLASEAARRERMNREIEIAREVQERLFPQSLQKFPELCAAGFCRPAQGVGGHFHYDFLVLESGKIGVAVGDVSGKGISAALLMASARLAARYHAVWFSRSCGRDAEHQPAGRRLLRLESLRYLLLWRI